jgi:putative glutamine amidotransferase
MSTPLIGITTYGENRNGSFILPADYVESVRRAGGAVVLLPPGEAHFEEVLCRIDGLILAGGGDIDPVRYGGASHKTMYMLDERRDTMELPLAQQAMDRNLPTLAICRGCQIINIALGATLLPHIPDVYGEKVKHRLPPREPVPHEVQVNGDTRLADIMGATCVNPMSWHHQAVDQPGTGVEVIGRAPDNVPEAFDVPEKENLIAIQWHPELTADRDPTQQRLFDWLVRKSTETSVLSAAKKLNE